MTSNDVNLPQPRSPGPVTQAATVWIPAEYLARHLTPGGLAAFHSEVTRFSVTLCAELERQVEAAVLAGRQPEHTAEAVERACLAYRRRVGAEVVAAEERARHNRSVLAVILVTGATAGVNVTQHYLHSGLQIAVFAAFVLAFVAGLGLMWVGRPARSSGGDP